MGTAVTLSDAQLQDVLLRLQRLEQLMGQPVTTSDLYPAPAPAMAQQIPGPVPASPAVPNIDQFNYLVTALGFDPQTAAMIVTMQDKAKAGISAGPAAAAITPALVAPAAPAPAFLPLSDYLRAVTPPLP
jgi:hypothetical protein